MEKERIVGTAYAQSCIEGFEATKAIDSDPNTCWKAEPYYRWWLMDCGCLCSIDTITVETGQEGKAFYRYAIDYSTDRINWKELCEKTDDQPPLPGGESYSAKVKARYIRITMTYCSEGEKVALRNVEVIGMRLDCDDTAMYDLTKERVRVLECDEYDGFSECSAKELESGWQDQILCCDRSGGHIAFYNVNFGQLSGQQLRGFFYLPETDRSLRIHAEIHLDSEEGPIIGTMTLHRLYRSWYQLACDLADGIYGTRNMYFCVKGVDAPQRLGILWLQITPKTVLSCGIIDHADEVPVSEGEYRAYFGNIHCHTSFSDGAKTPSFAYDYARYVAGLDFLGITEHSNLFDDTFDASASKKWRDIKRFAEEKTEDGKFLALMGSETTWYNEFGHMNIYGADFFLNTYELRYNDTVLYYEKLKEFPKVINQWNHPWSCGNRHLDMFEPYDSELDKVMYTIEINSLECTEMDGLYYYVYALDLGWHVSPVGNQDNHRADWGTVNDIRTGVVMKQLTKADFYDAIRNHRTYYSSARKLKVVYDVNGEMMGSVIVPAKQYVFHVQLSNEPAGAALEKIEVWGEHGAVLYTQQVSGYEADIHFSIERQSRYYFLKVCLADGTFAATAPVWVE